MAVSRKDSKGRALRKGETERTGGKGYVYTYMDNNHKRRYIYATKLNELRDREDEVVKSLLNGIDAYSSKKEDLNCFFDRLISMQTGLRETTREHKVYLYNLYLRKTIGTRKIGDIKYSDLRLFYIQLMKDRNLSWGTIGMLNSMVCSSMALAMRDNVINSNPASGILGGIGGEVKKDVKVRRALTLEQQKIFIESVKNHHRYNELYPLVVFMLGTGCRIGEALGLRWSDIDFDNRTISINRTLRKRIKEKNGSYFVLNAPKTKSGYRIIPIMDQVYDILMIEKKRSRSLKKSKTLEIDGMKGFVFLSLKGDIYYNAWINCAFRKIIKQYNEEETNSAAKEKRKPLLLPEDFSSHWLRHTFCTRFCENESNIKIIQAVMGHSDIKTTMNVYAEATADTLQKEMERFSQNMKIF